jgi:hypothetical protein
MKDDKTNYDDQPKPIFTLFKCGMILLISFVFTAPPDIQSLRHFISQNSEAGIRQASIQVGIELLVGITGVGLIGFHFFRRRRR